MIYNFNRIIYRNNFWDILNNLILTARDAYFKHVFEVVTENAKKGSPSMGTNFWGRVGEARSESADGKVTPVSLLLADPWQEPQGLNSVFDSDKIYFNFIETAGQGNEWFV